MIVLIVFALGDIVGKITKGKLSGMMVVMLLFLVGFLTKLFPADIIDQGATALSNWTIAMVLFNMGTTLNVKQLIEGVENRINGGTLYAGFLRCDASGIPDHRI